MSTYKTPVSGSKLKAFHREFPWLKRYLDQGRSISLLKVERVDATLGTRNVHWLRVSFPDNDPWISSPKFWLYEYLVVLDLEGSLLIRVGLFPYTPPRRWWQWWPPKEQNRLDVSDTLEKALLRVGDDAQKAHFVLSILPTAKYVAREVNPDDVEYDVTIYKSPKEMSIPQWLERCIQNEQKEINEAVERIDNAAA